MSDEMDGLLDNLIVEASRNNEYDNRDNLAAAKAAALNAAKHPTLAKVKVERDRYREALQRIALSTDLDVGFLCAYARAALTHEEI